jgi:hypothetical protein
MGDILDETVNLRDIGSRTLMKQAGNNGHSKPTYQDLVARRRIFMADWMAMKHRFLIHALNHTFLLVDISGAGLPNEACPPEGKPQVMPSLRFQIWQNAEQHLLNLGADRKSLDAALDHLKITSTAVLTIT